MEERLPGRNIKQLRDMLVRAAMAGKYFLPRQLHKAVDEAYQRAGWGPRVRWLGLFLFPQDVVGRGDWEYLLESDCYVWAMEDQIGTQRVEELLNGATPSDVEISLWQRAWIERALSGDDGSEVVPHLGLVQISSFIDGRRVSAQLALLVSGGGAWDPVSVEPLGVFPSRKIALKEARRFGMLEPQDFDALREYASLAAETSRASKRWRRPANRSQRKDGRVRSVVGRDERPARTKRRSRSEAAIPEGQCVSIPQPPQSQLRRLWDQEALARGWLAEQAAVRALRLEPADIAALYECAEHRRSCEIMDGAPLTMEERERLEARLVALGRELPGSARREWVAVAWPAVGGTGRVAFLCEEKDETIRLLTVAGSEPEGRLRLREAGILLSDYDRRPLISGSDARHYDTMAIRFPTQMSVRQRVAYRVLLACRLPTGEPVPTSDHCHWMGCGGQSLVYLVSPERLLWFCPSCGAIEYLSHWRETSWAREYLDRATDSPATHGSSGSEEHR